MKVSMDKKYRIVAGQPVRVLCTDRRCDKYPVVALVDECDHLYTYTADGYYCGTSESPQNLVEVSEWDDFKIDEPVMALTDARRWMKGYFAGISSTGKPKTWDNGRTEWTASGSTSWDECRRPTKEELEK